MTQTELRQYYKDRAALRNTEETISGLRKYVAASGDDLGQEITLLEESAHRQADALHGREADVLAALDAVKDDCRRAELRMHFCRGMEWKEIAFVLGTTVEAVKRRCLRAMRDSIPK